MVCCAVARPNILDDSFKTINEKWTGEVFDPFIKPAGENIGKVAKTVTNTIDQVNKEWTGKVFDPIIRPAAINTPGVGHVIALGEKLRGYDKEALNTFMDATKSTAAVAAGTFTAPLGPFAAATAAAAAHNMASTMIDQVVHPIKFAENKDWTGAFDTYIRPIGMNTPFVGNAIGIVEIARGYENNGIATIKAANKAIAGMIVGKASESLSTVGSAVVSNLASEAQGALP